MKMSRSILCIAIALSLIGVCGTIGVQAEYTSHAPIRIDSNSDFESLASSEGWSGDGTENDPWIIENYDIDGTGYGYCLYIGNTTDYFVVSYNYFHDASGNSGTYFWNSGLILNNVRNGLVENNCAWDNAGHGGILLKDSSDNTINHNYATDNQRGLYLYYSDDNTIIYNNFSSNSVAGIYMSNSDDNTVANNIVGYNNLFGIWLVSSGDNTINDSIVTSNGQRGIYLHGLSSGNTIRNNTLESNLYGVYIFMSASGNTIYNNNFDNTNQALDNGNDNVWDNGYPSGGNHWSDYTGDDDYSGPGQNISGSDDIGDTDYTVSGSVVDDYPMMDSVGTEGLGKWDEPSGLGKWDEPS